MIVHGQTDLLTRTGRLGLTMTYLVSLCLSLAAHLSYNVPYERVVLTPRVIVVVVVAIVFIGVVMGEVEGRWSGGGTKSVNRFVENAGTQPVLGSRGHLKMMTHLGPYAPQGSRKLRK